MPELNEPGLNDAGLNEPEPTRPEPTGPEPNSSRAALADVAWVVGGFLVLAVVGGVLWWLLAEPPYFVRTQTDAVMGQAELARRIPVDGIFVAIGLLGSAALGFALMSWRRRDPLLVLLVGVLASVGAAFLALRLGETLGHRDVRALVEQAAVGDRVRDTLKVITTWVVAAWPLGFLIAAVSSLLGRSPEGPGSDQASRPSGPGQLGEGGVEDPDQVVRP